MTTIKQFNKTRTMVKGRKVVGNTIDSLKRKQPTAPAIHKGGARRGKGMMKVR